MNKPNQDRLYVVKKYVFAPNAETALKKERSQVADDIWIDDEWKKLNMPTPTPDREPMGFKK